MKRIARQEARKLSLLITARGTSALRPARRSIGTKATIRIAASASSASIFGSPHPQSSTWSRAISSETRPTEIAAMPA